MLKLSPFLKFVFPLMLLSSCLLKNESPIESSSDNANLIQSGDIVVANTGNDSIILLSSNGTYKTTLYDEATSGNVFNALGYDTLNNQILWTYDHGTSLFDAVNAFALYDGAVSVVMSNSNLQGTLPGVARLTGGQLSVLEGATTLEQFTSAGVRVGNPLSSALITTTVDLNPLLTGGFIVCSNVTATTVRTYSAAGVLSATATSATPTPSLGALTATGCIQNASGQVIVAYSGATDYVRVYSSAAMTTVVWDFINQNVLTSPGKLAVRENGNILVTDTGLNQIVEISSAGAFVQVIGGSVLSVPNSILVVP